MSRPLDVLFRDALTRYPVARRDEKFGRESSFWPLIAELKQALEAVPALAASKRAKVKVSFGQGGWAEVPNFALMDVRETERPSAGLYIVYLVKADASALVLSLNQGSADLMFEAKGRTYDLLRGRADRVRAALKLDAVTAAGFGTDTIDLASSGQFPRAYAAGSVIAKPYSATEMPSAAQLVDDLGALWTAYQTVIPSTRLRLADVGRATPAASPRWRA